MSEKQSGAVRRRSRAEVDRLVAEYEASGLTRQEFCIKHGLSLVTLDRYRKCRQQRQEKVAGASQFVQVELSDAKAEDGDAAGRELVVVLAGGRRIEVRSRFDSELLVQLVHVLEQV
jgi:hypothetical protein